MEAGAEMSAQSNPFRIDDKPGEETRQAVRAVLIFVGQSFEAMDRSGDIFRDGAMAGASHILWACASALKESDDSNTGGAA